MIQNQVLSPHFELREFTDSQTARKYGISNVPSPEAVENLRALCVHTLEPLREALGLPIIITSGFRTKALNDKLAHSSERSQHMQGQAADFYVNSAGSIVQGSSQSSGAGGTSQGSGAGGTSTSEATKSSAKFKVQGGEEPSPRELLIMAFREILTNPKIDYDQLILYPSFIHVSYVSPKANRHGILKAQGNGKLGYGRLNRADALKIE